MQQSRHVGSNLATVLLTLIPVFKTCAPCPTCMPIYAAIFSLFGLELADYSHYIIPAMLVSMLISVITMYQQTIATKTSFKPVIACVIASLLLLFSKFVTHSPWGVIFAMSALLGATLQHQYSIRQSLCVGCNKAKSCDM